MLSNESITDTVKRVMKESLQLGAGDEIADDMQLTGGEYDLDSLDKLLIVSSLEKEFGIKFSNDQLGPESFSSVPSIVALLETLV